MAATFRGLHGSAPERGLAGILGAFVILELLVRVNVLDERYLPAPSSIIRRLLDLLGTSALWSDIWGTFSGWILGLGLAAAIGIPVGLLLGSSTVLERAFRFPLEFLRPIPSVALIPLAVLTFGSGLESKVFLVFFASVWPLVIQSVYGIKAIDPVLMETSRAFSLTRVEKATRVVAPACAPFIGAGLRISAAIALILAITAELVIGSDGMGSAILLAESAGNIESIYALVALTGLMGIAVNGAFMALERRFTGWHADKHRRAT